MVKAHRHIAPWLLGLLRSQLHVTLLQLCTKRKEHRVTLTQNSGCACTGIHTRPLGQAYNWPLFNNSTGECLISTVKECNQWEKEPIHETGMAKLHSCKKKIVQFDYRKYSSVRLHSNLYCDVWLDINKPQLICTLVRERREIIGGGVRVGEQKEKDNWVCQLSWMLHSNYKADSKKTGDRAWETNLRLWNSHISYSKHYPSCTAVLWVGEDLDTHSKMHFVTTAVEHLTANLCSGWQGKEWEWTNIM